MDWNIVGGISVVGLIIIIIIITTKCIINNKKIFEELCEAEKDLSQTLRSVVAFVVNNMFVRLIEQIDNLDSTDSELQRKIGRWEFLMQNAIDDGDVCGTLHDILSEIHKYGYLNSQILDQIKIVYDILIEIAAVNRNVKESMTTHSAINLILERYAIFLEKWQKFESKQNSVCIVVESD